MPVEIKEIVVRALVPDKKPAVKAAPEPIQQLSPELVEACAEEVLKRLLKQERR